MRVKLDIVLTDPKRKPLMKQEQRLNYVLALLEARAAEMPQASVTDVYQKVLMELQECREPETLGGALYRAVTESEKAQKGSPAEKRIRATIARALCSDEHPEYAELKQDQLVAIRADVEDYFIAVWMGAVEVALEEALKLSPEQATASAVAIVPNAEGAA